jgi:hypothetical protein
MMTSISSTAEQLGNGPHFASPFKAEGGAKRRMRSAASGSARIASLNPSPQPSPLRGEGVGRLSAIQQVRDAR